MRKNSHQNQTDSNISTNSGKKKKLTARQEQVLEFIKKSIDTDGFPPTVREIAGFLEIVSLNAVRRHLQALEKKGYLEIEPGKSRGIKLFQDDVHWPQLPIVGKIAAGPMTTAVEDVEGQVVVDPDFWGDTRDMFLLRVRGDSMYPKLEDGDLVVVRRQPFADPGSLVVALMGEEATVKQLVKKDGRFYLHPLNPAYPDIPIESGFSINGLVVGLIRKI